MAKKQTRQISYEEMKEYGDYFRSVRLSLGYTIKEMADIIGIYHTTLYRWEHSKIIPQTDINYLVTKYEKIGGRTLINEKCRNFSKSKTRINKQK